MRKPLGRRHGVSLTSEDLQQLLAGIRSRDPETYESAYELLRLVVREFVPDLLAELEQAPDACTRGKFIELLGHPRVRGSFLRWPPNSATPIKLFVSGR
jgi:hypothetical protein